MRNEEEQQQQQHDQPAGTRREFLQTVAVGTLGVGAALGLAGCGGSDGGTISLEFKHGVASGDPLVDRVILWTRVTTASTGDVELRYDMATDASMSSVVRSGTVLARASADHTAKVDVTGLNAGTTYWYRFEFAGVRSTVGRTRTLPAAGSTARVKLAVFSCSNYPAGFFNAYAEAAKIGDLDATLHLGDYIYEYSRDGYASAQAAALGRLSDPANEIVSLSDYRRRYAQYRSDADLQAVHGVAPMIAVWDDHELANNAYATGAENHQSATEGSFTARRAAAFQAWAEWLPVRLPDASKPDQIYRSFNFGNVLSLHMLDTRQVGRDKQLDYADFTTPTGLNAAAFTAAMGNTSRTLLGSAQQTWLTSQMAASTATWQVLGQQVLMGRMNVPAPLVTFQVTVAQYAALVARAQTNPASLTPAEQAILAQPAIPYNLDAWDGYTPAREVLLATAKSLNKNLISLAGDTHNAWANDLRDLGGAAIGVEFATPGISSPGFETVFPNENPATFAATLAQLIDPLYWCDTSQRGFMTLTCTPTEARADWTFVSTVSSRSYTVTPGRSLRTLPGVRRIAEV